MEKEKKVKKERLVEPDVRELLGLPREKPMGDEQFALQVALFAYAENLIDELRETMRFAGSIGS